jgi:hypothetical protein
MVTGRWREWGGGGEGVAWMTGPHDNVYGVPESEATPLDLNPDHRHLNLIKRRNLNDSGNRIGPPS